MFDERTEPATPKRRRKAREEGRVARSAELVGSVIMLAVLWALPHLLPGLGQSAAEYATRSLTAAARRSIGADDLGRLAAECLRRTGMIAAPVLGLVVAAALVGNVAQVGLHASFGVLQPKLSRADPIQGLRRLLSARSVLELAKGLAKVAIVGFSGWHYCSGHWESLFLLSATDPSEIASRVGAMAYGMAFQMVATMALLAALDAAYQRWQFERSLRMTKQEVRDEMREAEGNPETKARLRQRRREIARRRMMADVPRASVVITNPTHYAVALQYEVGQQGAPKLLAKGRDLIAQRIRALAEEHDVPLVENPPLARAIYQEVEIGEEVPPALYRAVAEVIALVWRAARSRV